MATTIPVSESDDSMRYIYISFRLSAAAQQWTLGEGDELDNTVLVSISDVIIIIDDGGHDGHHR